MRVFPCPANLRIHLVPPRHALVMKFRLRSFEQAIGVRHKVVVRLRCARRHPYAAAVGAFHNRVRRKGHMRCKHMTLNLNPLQPKQLQPKGDEIVLAVPFNFQ